MNLLVSTPEHAEETGRLEHAPAVVREVHQYLKATLDIREETRELCCS